VKSECYLSMRFALFIHVLKLLFKFVHIRHARDQWIESEAKLTTRQFNDDDEFEIAVCSDLESSIRQLI